MVELLSPAGDLERLKFAFMYGADAVYIGGQNYSLRANAKNFSIDDIKEGVTFAHSLNKKVYVTVNIVFHEDDLEGIKEYLLKLDEIGVDAIIVSDIAIMKLHQDLGLKLELHISTQSSVLNHEAVKFYQSLGAKRIVLAREASRDDIKTIKDETGADLECFVHGAMCTSTSGRCVLSNYATLRDSNRGGCVQVCRFIFDINSSDKPFSITPKDLNMVVNVPEMINIGVNSFKVEGRMRSIYYIATVIKTYREIIDKTLNNSLTDAYIKYYQAILNRCANRDSAPQFFNRKPTKDEQYYLGRQEESNQDFLGLILDYNKETKEVTIEERNFFTEGTVVEFFGPNLDTQEFTLGTIYDENNNEVDAARHPRGIYKFKCDIELTPNSMMRLKNIDIRDFL
ncbi:MAG: U32 family peptidase [Firmicutes bacterium]|nr:U32 family peptidase [Bacillota bacterium]